jgi:hypothetical protein
MPFQTCQNVSLELASQLAKARHIPGLFITPGFFMSSYDIVSPKVAAAPSTTFMSLPNRELSWTLRASLQQHMHHRDDYLACRSSFRILHSALSDDRNVDDACIRAVPSRPDLRLPHRYTATHEASKHDNQRFSHQRYFILSHELEVTPAALLNM